MDYIEYTFQVNPVEGSEILIAELGETNFESFVETEDGVQAYIQKSLWSEDVLENIAIFSNENFQISYTFTEIPSVNWNEEWEKNFQPILIEDKCAVRATFHEPTHTEYEIIIDPKMSFGTGHHQTTFLMLKTLLNMDFTDKKVLDMGCGTGILAILTAMRGAKDILAVDIDEWCYQNAQENILLNNFPFIKIKLGDVSVIKEQYFDCIIANINRNILLEDIPHYVSQLNSGGDLLVSGFYEEDVPQITKKSEECGLVFIQKSEKENWVVLHFQKKR